MNTIGIIGGIGPESTIEYYRLIIKLYREQRPDGSYPTIIINSINLRKMLDLVADGKLRDLTEYLVGEVMKLAKAGAALGLFASNLPHLVFEDIARESPIPLISIVEATCEEVRRRGIKTAGLFGIGFTMQSDFYPRVFAKQGIRIVVPPTDDQRYIHEKYTNELIPGLLSDETREGLLGIVDRLKEREGIEGLILGGTELPLILRDETYHGMTFFNTSKIHAERTVALMLLWEKP
ncbi:MAG: amino acid racemase [Bacteroidota bacterium]